MISIFSKILLFCACIFSFSPHQILCDELPVVLWNVKGNSLLVKQVSALERDNKVYENALKEVLQDDAKILIFAVNKLSLEDFSANENSVQSNNTIQNIQSFLDQQRYMFLSSVNDPLDRIHKLHCGVQEIVVDQSIDENILLEISLAFDKSCVVILHITDAGIVGPKEPTPVAIKNAFQPSFEKTSKNIVGIFTGLKSSWGNLNDEHHKMRNLLAVEDSDSNFLNVSGCLIMYGKNAVLRMKEGNKTVSLPFPVDTTGSKCGNTSALLQLNFKPTGDISSVVLLFNFTNVRDSWTTQTTVEVSGDTYNLIGKDLEAPAGFSFSCGKYVLQNRNATSSVSVTFDRFQVQPFKVKEKFSDSFDCVTWFTIPIWMGLFVAVFFIAVVNCGAYSLFSIRTMDRFDDPKGKTISVAAGVD